MKNFLQTFSRYRDAKSKHISKVYLAYDHKLKKFDVCFFSHSFSKTFLPHYELITDKKP